eukprot:jgi/Ulvmu1/8052/UM004_0289.1
MTITCDEHVPGANVARAAWNGTCRSGGAKPGTYTGTTATAGQPRGQHAQLGFIADSWSSSAGFAQSLPSSGLRRVATHDVRVKLNDKLQHSDAGTVMTCSRAMRAGNNIHRATLRSAPSQGQFSPSVDLVSHESVQARQMPSNFLEAGHFGSLRQQSANSTKEAAPPANLRRSITVPSGPMAACADAKTQTVCEASAQTEEDNSVPAPERVIRIPWGARPASCTPVIVPVKASRKDSRGKAGHKRTAKVRTKPRPTSASQNTATTTRARSRPTSAPVSRKPAPASKQTARPIPPGRPKATPASHTPSRPRQATAADPHLPRFASPSTPQQQSASQCEPPTAQAPHEHPINASAPCSPVHKVPTSMRDAPPTSMHDSPASAAPAGHPSSPHPAGSPHSHHSPRKSPGNTAPACCHCGGAPTSSHAPASGNESRSSFSRSAGGARTAPVPLRNPERQNMVTTLERALADLERDVLARSTQPSEASAPSFAASLDSLAALEAEISAQQRRLQSVGAVQHAGQNHVCGAPAPVYPPAATPACEPQGCRQAMPVASAAPAAQIGCQSLLGHWGAQSSCPPAQAPVGTGTSYLSDCRDVPPPGMLTEPSFSHTFSSTHGSDVMRLPVAAHDRARSSSPDGNFSTVSIEDRLKRLGLSEQISQLIKDITADSESTCSPAQSPGRDFPWRREAASVSDAASTVTLPSLAPPKPLLAANGLRSSSASPLDEFAGSRSAAGDTGQVSPALAASICTWNRASSRSPSPTESLPSMPGAMSSALISQSCSEGHHTARSPSGWTEVRHSRTDHSLDGESERRQSHTGAEGPFRGSSTARSVDEILSSVTQRQSSWAGSEGNHSASLQQGDDCSPRSTGNPAERGRGTPVYSPADSSRASRDTGAGPFAVKQGGGDLSFMSPLASSDTSVRADSTAATPADLRADVDSILCGSFWRS